MQKSAHKPLSELARDVMHDKEWWVLRNGWICSAEIKGALINFAPIAPDFVTAVRAMKKMEWIYRNGQLGMLLGKKSMEERPNKKPQAIVKSSCVISFWAKKRF